jgi:hypothetical protein
MMSVGLRCRELAPGRAAAAGSRACAGGGQDLSERGRSDPVLQPCEPAPGPATAPAWIFFGRAQHQLFDRLSGRWPARPAPALAVVPSACDGPSMPRRHGARSHREHLRPAPPGYQRGQHREPQPVRRLVPHRDRKLPTQHRVLVPQDKRFGLLRRLPAQENSRGCEQPPRHPVHQRDNHPRHRPGRPRTPPDPLQPAATHF